MKTRMQYKASFIINCIAQACAYGVAFLLMFIMINSFGSINGWNKYEVMFLYALSLLSYSVAGSFVIGIYNGLQDDIISGKFDDVLVKPVNAITYLNCSRFNWNYISHISLSIIVIIICFCNLEVTVNVKTILLLLYITLCGAGIYAGLLLMIRCPVFFLIKFDSIADILFFFREMSYYPLSILPKGLQIILTFILPYAFINYYPSQLILGIKSSLEHPGITLYLGALVAVVLLLISWLLFELGVRNYKSSGS